MKALDRIEKYFKKDFNFIINKIHWEDGISLLELSNKCGVCRDVFQSECKKRGLTLMSRSEAKLRSSKSKGENHWAFGLTKENSQWAKNHSKRMKKNNPVFNKETRDKMSVSLSEHFKKNLLPQEIKAKSLLDALNVEYISQHPLPPYVADFFFPRFSTVLEIDSTSKWGKERKLRADKRDHFLLKKGIKTIRVNKNDLSLDFIFNILKTNNII